jgi:CRISP-associated protein Cas1
LLGYLNGKTKSVDLASGEYKIEQQNSDDNRKKILSISYSEWKKSGFSRGGLNYMKNTESDKPFTLNKHVGERLDQWDEGVKSDG